MKTFKQYIKEVEGHRLNTVMDTNIRNKIVGINRSVSFDAGDPSKLNFPKNSMGQLVAPAKPKLNSIPSDMGVAKEKTQKTNLPSIPKNVGVGRSNTPVGSMPKAKLPSIPKNVGVGRSNTPVGSMPKAKTTNNLAMKDAWEKSNRFPGEGVSPIEGLTKGDKATPIDRDIRQYYSKTEIEDRTKDKIKAQPFYRDPIEKLKKDAEQTWNIKAREPKDSGYSKMYVGGSVEDRIDISSPKETMKSYTNRRKKDIDKWYIPDKTKDFDLVAARGYDKAKDPKTGIPDTKKEGNPDLWGSYMPSTGKVKIRKHPFRGKSTGAHEYGHVGSQNYDPKEKIGYDSEEMRQRELDARKNTSATDDAKDWWDSLYKGKNPRMRLSMFHPTSSKDTPNNPKSSIPEIPDERHVNPMGFTYPRSEKQVKNDQVFKGLGDRDRISIEKLNDRMIDQSRKELSQKYFRGGREPHTDTDLKKAALGSILPYANKEYDKKPIDPKTGNPNQLNFPKKSAALRKAEAIDQQKDYAKLGHFSIARKVFHRNYDLNYDPKKDNSNLKYPDSETGNPNQLNFPKGYKQYVKEALDKPFEYEHKSTQENSSGEKEHHYSFKDNNGDHTHVFISHSKDKDGKIKASVDFTDENGDIQATGKGSIRHFSTVKKIMQDHAKKHPDLKTYTFTGEKDSDKPGAGGRNRLYTKLTDLYGGHSEDINAYSSRHFIPVNRDKKGP